MAWHLWHAQCVLLAMRTLWTSQGTGISLWTSYSYCGDSKGEQTVHLPSGCQPQTTAANLLIKTHLKSNKHHLYHQKSLFTYHINEDYSMQSERNAHSLLLGTEAHQTPWHKPWNMCVLRTEDPLCRHFQRKEPKSTLRFTSSEKNWFGKKILCQIHVLEKMQIIQHSKLQENGRAGTSGVKIFTILHTRSKGQPDQWQHRQKMSIHHIPWNIGLHYYWWIFTEKCNKL